MPLKQSVPHLEALALNAIKPLVTQEALRVARVAVTKFVFDEIQAEEEEVSATQGDPNENDALLPAWEREIYLSDQVEIFKQHILSHVAPTLLESALNSVLKGIKDAVRMKQKAYTPTTNMTSFTREMYAIIKFCNLLVLSQRRCLNLEVLPKIIRTKMYNGLHVFKNLHTLILGSGSGGWVTEAYADKFLLGLPHMTCLVHFSLKYDCTINLIQVLAESCSKTLRVLDIERSKQVRDDSIAYFLQLRNLEDINIFQTDLTTQGQATLLLGLKQLRHLRRGDFLCDAIELFSEQGMAVKLKIEEFWASEEYYFHTEEQMELTAQICPEIKKMLFMFQNTNCRLQCLTAFEQLEDLELWGGSFYADGVLELLEVVGVRLKRLSLVHVDEIDEKGIALLTTCCPNVEKLGLHNCEFVESSRESDDNDPAFRQRDRLLQLEAEREVKSMLQPLLELKILKIVSTCPANYIQLILGQCLNVREVFMGMNTGLSDACIANILTNNGLQHLETLTVQRCKLVTMAGIDLLLEQCSKLKVLKDLAYFDLIHDWQIQELRWKMRSQNLILDTGEEEEKEKDFAEGSFMRQALKNQFAPLDNSIEWEYGWDES